MGRLDTPIPPRLAKRPRDKRGYPIPYSAYIDSKGNPQFTVNDIPRGRLISRNDLCPLCGEPNTRGRWFVGGSLPAYHKDGLYIDAPMHNDCAHYALMVCPFIAVPSYAHRIEDAKMPANEPALSLVDHTAVTSQPLVFVAVQARATHLIEAPHGGGYYHRPARPFMRVEYWRGGVELSAEDAAPIVAADLARATEEMERLAAKAAG